MKSLVSRSLGGLIVLLLAAFASAQSWTAVTAPFPGSGAGAAFLLTDGTVMVHQEQSADDAWYRLTPDINGSYVDRGRANPFLFPALLRLSGVAGWKAPH